MCRVVQNLQGEQRERERGKLAVRNAGRKMLILGSSTNTSATIHHKENVNTALDQVPNNVLHEQGERG